MATIYVKLGSEGNIFQSQELGMFLDKDNALEIDQSLVSTRLESFFKSGFLVKISKVEYDIIKLKNSNARNIPLVTVGLTSKPTWEPVESVSNIPPTNPIRNKRYLVWDKPTDSWENYANCIAWFTGTSWEFIEPINGLILPIYELGVAAVYLGTYPSGIWTIGGQVSTDTQKWLQLTEILSQNIPEDDGNGDSPAQDIPSWILGITIEDIARWNKAADDDEIPEPPVPPTPPTPPVPPTPPPDPDLELSELYKVLTYWKGYLLVNDHKIFAGFSDKARDSERWSGKNFFNFMDQPVRKEDQVFFKSVEGSKTGFVPGFAGKGWLIDEDGHATVQSLTVRGKYEISELVINKISGSNGAIAVTDSAEIQKLTVEYDPALEIDVYICYIDTKEDTIFVPFHVDDIVRCQRWTGIDVKYYYARVLEVEPNRFIMEAPIIEGDGEPQIGDSVHRFGNFTDEDRRGLLYLTSSDTNSPYLDVLDDLDGMIVPPPIDPDLDPPLPPWEPVIGIDYTGKIKVRLGKLNGITDDRFGALEGYGLYTQNGYFTGAISTVVGNIGTFFIDDNGMESFKANIGGVPDPEGNDTKLIISKLWIDDDGITVLGKRVFAVGDYPMPGFRPEKNSIVYIENSEDGTDINTCLTLSASGTDVEEQIALDIISGTVKVGGVTCLTKNNLRVKGLTDAFIDTTWILDISGGLIRTATPS